MARKKAVAYREHPRRHPAVQPPHWIRALTWLEETLWGGCGAEPSSLEACASTCPTEHRGANQTDFLKITKPRKSAARSRRRQRGTCSTYAFDLLSLSTRRRRYAPSEISGPLIWRHQTSTG